MTENKISVLLVNLGGPSSETEIKPFLKNLFLDPDIINIPGGFLLRPILARMISSLRYQTSSKHYELIGGKSPILEITKAQANALENELNKEASAKVRVAMRYSEPFIKDALKEISGENLIVLPLYPQYSITTTGSVLNEIKRTKKKIKRSFSKMTFVNDFHDKEDYIDAFVSAINSYLNDKAVNFKSTPVLLFSAHGLPEKLIEKGDPYKEQIEKSVELIMGKIGGDFKSLISYQSRAGVDKWLKPTTEDVLAKIGETGGDVLVIPISFVSENLETLYEMDILFKEKAKEFGIDNYHRLPCFNDNPKFISCLKNIVLENAKR